MKKFYTDLDDEQIRVKSYYLRSILAEVDCLLPDIFVLEDKETKIRVEDEECAAHRIRFIYTGADGNQIETIQILYKQQKEMWPLEKANFAYDTYDIYSMEDWGWMGTEQLSDLLENWHNKTRNVNNIQDILKTICDYPENIIYKP